MRTALVVVIAVIACSTPNGTPQPSVAKDRVITDAATPDVIAVVVTGLRSDEGTVRCFLYDNREDFPDSSRHISAVALPSGRGAICKFPGVRRNRDYAILIFHDENNDNSFQKGGHGIHKEGYGFSNDAKVRSSVPSYDECRFHMTQGTFTTPITMQYDAEP